MANFKLYLEIELNVTQDQESTDYQGFSLINFCLKVSYQEPRL